ncbi:HAD family hydrolase [Luteimonas soli]|uniref:HAD family hydrolase n=1 Tax=Luteimonas soli TaxID=1648966 RepID=A0ABV7XKG9_9GAMM
MSGAPAVVLFDLDGVLAHYDHASRLRLLAERSGAGVEAVSRALFESGLERDADLGLHDAQGQVDEFARRLGRPVSLDDCIEARRASMRADADMLSLVRHVARQSQVAILTNNNLLLRDHLPAICPPLFPLFDGRVFCSAQFRLAKPDPAIFLQCLAAIDATPAQALFIDDKAENAEGARRAGLRAHHYTGVSALRAWLKECGIAGD